MSDTSMLHVRVDSATKEQAARVLGSMGMNTSMAVRLFLHRIATDRAFPLELRSPNAETLAAMAEADQIIKTRRARFNTAQELVDDLQKNALV